ncbi:hypothetical protein GE061_014798 [Apolygus lucorum]|uniref:Uncharacterized protein n=1 Tax=Apolygus lucorum TaxID=248454 RepID=A0A8S9XN99_APOLU|nr:hypothetical protein GE061_014798 [Apolygus lucorum]
MIACKSKMKKSTTSNGDPIGRISSQTFKFTSLGGCGSGHVEMENNESTDNVLLVDEKTVNSDGALWISSDSSSCCSIISNFVDLDEYESRYNLQLVERRREEVYDGAEWISSETSSCSSFRSEMKLDDSDDSCEVTKNLTACSKCDDGRTVCNEVFKTNERVRSQQEDDEIICVSDEEVGTSGGILTLDANIKPSKRVEWILQKYTRIRPPPLVRPM